MSKVKGISNEIAKILTEYTTIIETGISIAKDDVAKRTAKNLRKTSPEGDTKSYRKGWTVSTIRTAKIVHNKTDYQLTHLLENGHAKVNGGRVSPIVHIKPAEETAIKEYIDAVEKVIKK